MAESSASGRQSMPGHYLAWRQVACCFLLMGAVAFTSSCYTILSVPLARAFGPDRMTLMLAMTVLSGSAAVLAPFAGFLLDRLSVRLLMTLGATAMTGGYAAMSLAGNFTHIMLIYGLVIAPANVLIGSMAMTVLLSRWFVRRRGAAIGVALAGVSVASIVYPPITQWILDHHYWRDAFRQVSVMLAATVIPAALLVVNRPSDRNLQPDGAVDAPPPLATVGKASASAMAILRDPSFWLAAVTFAIVLSGMKGVVTSLAPIVLDRGLKTSDAALLLSLYGICGLTAKLAFAGLADRLGARSMLVATLLGFAVGMSCFWLAPLGGFLIVVGVVMIGLFGGMMMPLQSLLLPRIFGEHMIGRAMGLVGIVTFSGLLASPPAFGRVFDTTGSYSLMFGFYSVAALVALFALPWLRLGTQPGKSRAAPPVC
ncbi:MFS transporter [Sphingomonas flavalba]|uniref:MFS transporter n=1 Tax=Sphingomonas flavalba TaxID=2559804 RepID=UPI0039E0B385